MKVIENDRTTGTLVGPNGEILSRPTVILSADDARMLREYKKFLMRHGFQEKLYCRECFGLDLHDGVEAHVTDSQVLFACRHRMLFHQGQSY